MNTDQITQNIETKMREIHADAEAEKTLTALRNSGIPEHVAVETAARISNRYNAQYLGDGVLTIGDNAPDFRVCINFPDFDRLNIYGKKAALKPVFESKSQS
jgi:hypothetical protein